MKVSLCAVGARSLVALLALAGQAQAQTLPDPDIDCDKLPEPRVFIEAGDTQMTMLAELARRLRDAEHPITLVYLPRSTCTLAGNYFDGKLTTENMRYVPSVAEDAAWTSTPHQCTNTGGYPIDLGIGATFISSCGNDVTSHQRKNVKIWDGPVQAYGFVVPDGSLSASGGGITWEEAYWVFSGQGITANATPWTAEPNPSGGTPSVFIRGVATSTLLTCSANVAPDKLPASAWQGYRADGQNDRSSVVVNGVYTNKTADAALRDATIGIVGVDVYEANRGKLDMLAFQAPGQTYGYYPDSTPAATDKVNVRDGHYVPWSYTQYIAAVDKHGVPVNPEVERLLKMMDGVDDVRLTSAVGVDPAFDLDALEVFAKKGLVPRCAMHVSREKDGGELTACDPVAPCGCLFESAVDPVLAATTPWQDRCPVCDEETPCLTGTCRHGYCEAH